MTERKRIGDIDAKIDDLWSALIQANSSSPGITFDPCWNHVNKHLYRPVRDLCRDGVLLSVHLHIRRTMLDRS